MVLEVSQVRCFAYPSGNGAKVWVEVCCALGSALVPYVPVQEA